jgi:peptidoglycan/xylan/chitin deacetylase (PgdA/CDA1 family)
MAYPLLLAVSLVVLAGCATLDAGPAGAPIDRSERVAGRDYFESEDWVVVLARREDTPRRLAARFLGDARHAFMIEDYNETATLRPGQQVVIPKRPWNVTGVEPSGYQLVPILVYHDIGPEPKGRMLIGVKSFAEQMRYLKTNGYRVISLRDFYDFISMNRQVPRKSVVLTFDDGYKSFLEYAYPVLKDLGFTATLFVYTDYVGAGRKALAWQDLARLAREGFEVEGHSKTHNDLRRQPGEDEADHARRVRAEMEVPQRLFQQRFGQAARFLAYPYGAVDDAVIEGVREHGYVAAFTVFREGNGAFVHPFRVRRSQIYAEMSLEDFAKNLNVFSHESLR